MIVGDKVKIVRSKRTGGLPVMADCNLLRETGLILSIDQSRIDGDVISEHATVDFPPLGRDQERLLKVRTEYLQVISWSAP